MVFKTTIKKHSIAPRKRHENNWMFPSSFWKAMTLYSLRLPSAASTELSRHRPSQKGSNSPCSGLQLSTLIRIIKNFSPYFHTYFIDCGPKQEQNKSLPMIPCLEPLNSLKLALVALNWQRGELLLSSLLTNRQLAIQSHKALSSDMRSEWGQGEWTLLHIVNNMVIILALPVTLYCTWKKNWAACEEKFNWTICSKSWGSARQLWDVTCYRWDCYFTLMVHFKTSHRPSSIIFTLYTVKLYSRKNRTFCYFI